MTTKIYGASDDLIEFEGDVCGEVGAEYAGHDDTQGALVMCSDGTMLRAKYGKVSGGIWELTVIYKGGLFEAITVCEDEDADPYSDIAHFTDGLKWAYVAHRWEKV